MNTLNPKPEERSAAQAPAIACPQCAANGKFRWKGTHALAIAGLALAGVVSGTLWQRSRASAQLASETQEMATPSVLTAAPQPGPSEIEIVLPGNLMAFTEAPIYARTNGYIKAWNTDLGAAVKAGDVLAEIEAPDVDAQLSRATANLSQARANLEIARLNFQRNKNLQTTKVISQQEFDQSRTSLEAQEAAVKAGEADVQNLKVQQGFQKIVAPFTGVITRRNTDVGALINGGGAANSAQELFHLARTDILRLFVQVPEVYSKEIRADSPAWLEVAQAPDTKIEGRIAHLAGAIDPATRTLLTEIQVPNEQGKLFPGAYASVHLKLRLEHSPLVVPVNTLLFRGEGTQVGIVDAAGTVHLKTVSLGRDFGTSVEVTQGVSAKDRLILNPPDSLGDGLKVRLN